MNETIMLWLGIGIGLFCGIPLAILIVAMCVAARRGDEINRQIRSNFPTSPD
jgi:uncharacterized membrane-anchored protein YhcB (DUF1043 family)